MRLRRTLPRTVWRIEGRTRMVTKLTRRLINDVSVPMNDAKLCSRSNWNITRMSEQFRLLLESSSPSAASLPESSISPSRYPLCSSGNAVAAVAPAVSAPGVGDGLDGATNFTSLGLISICRPLAGLVTFTKSSSLLRVTPGCAARLSPTVDIGIIRTNASLAVEVEGGAAVLVVV